MLDAKIEAILFFKAEPVEIGELVKIFGVGEEQIKEALSNLENRLAERGVRLIRKDSAVMLGTAPEMGSLIENLIKDELARELSKAGLETLSTILYRGPLSRSEIDWIRGVNSTYILRSLAVRGLIEKIPNPSDQRSFLYRPTFKLMGHLGITRLEELPEYGAVREQINQFQKSFNQENVS